MPNVFESFSFESLEFAGLFTGVGYSLVGIATTRGTLTGSREIALQRSKIFVANPCQLTSPAAVQW